MATTATTIVQPASTARDSWYGIPADEVAKRLWVDPVAGLSAERAVELLERHGPNALPAEPPDPGLKRFLEQYRSLWELGKLLARRQETVTGA
jgi:Cation transporter/ATPase, N-terminus